ncbi:MAG: tetratricopeptide repeat protein [Planctomycetales bacterium]|nr:tetratricopeptide repeat protein [Planctomycetales bacterium]
MRRKILFAAIATLLFFGFAESLAWLCGVQPLSATSDPLVGFSDQAPLLTQTIRNGNTWLETAPQKRKWFNHQAFPRQRPDNTIRIFTLGGSTTYGRPYADATSYSGWLRTMLSTPPVADKQFEVINAGGISYASYRIVKVMEELARYEPDAFIIYTGHNEFLEERTYRHVKRLPPWLQSVAGWLSSSRTYSLLANLLTQVRSPNRDKSSEASTQDDSRRDNGEIVLSSEVKAKLDSGVGPDAYHRDDALRRQIVSHYRQNLKRMIELADQCGAKIVFVQPASNLADCSPFKSECDDPSNAQQVVQLYQAAQQAFARENLTDALAKLDEVSQLAPRYADGHFLRGKIQMAKGDVDAALSAFQQALSEDVCPLRAIPEIVLALEEVCDQHNVPLIRFADIVAQQSELGIPGEAMFLDHVHPTIEGHQLLAIELWNQLVEWTWIRSVPAAERSTWLAKVDSQVRSQIDKTAQGDALRNLAKVMSWAGKQDEANRLAQQAAEFLTNDAETLYLAANALLEAGETEKAMQQLQAILQADPQHVPALNSLGSAYLRLGQLPEAQSSLEKAVQLLPDFAPAHNNLGAVFQQQLDFEQAKIHYQRAIQLEPRYVKAINNLGVIFREEGRLTEAKRQFERVLAIDVTSVEGRYNLAVTQVALHEVADAERLLQSVLQDKPNYAPAQITLGSLLEQTGQWPEAIAVYRPVVFSNRPSMAAAQRLAWLLATCPDTTQQDSKLALEIASSLVKALPKDPESWSLMAAALATSGDFVRATRCQENAVANADQDQLVRHNARLKQLQSSRPLLYMD